MVGCIRRIVQLKLAYRPFYSKVPYLVRSTGRCEYSRMILLEICREIGDEAWRTIDALRDNSDRRIQRYFARQAPRLQAYSSQGLGPQNVKEDRLYQSLCRI